MHFAWTSSEVLASVSFLAMRAYLERRSGTEMASRFATLTDSSRERMYTGRSKTKHGLKCFFSETQRLAWAWSLILESCRVKGLETTDD